MGIHDGTMSMKGALSAQLNKGGVQKAPLWWRIKNALRPAFWYGWADNQAAKIFTGLTGIPTMTAELSIVLTKADGRRINYGVVAYRVVTTAFVNFVVDQLQTETSVFGDFKYHDSGVGTTAENASDTGIETTDGESRATGTQTEASANQYRSVGTVTYSTTKAITEHGLFNDSSAGTLMDRSVFSAINVVNTDSISFTYTLTISSGG
jgi:hypothetical protein